MPVKTNDEEQYFTPEFKFRVSKTNDSDLATESVVEATPAEVVSYLNDDPRHAVVLVGSTDELFGEKTFEPSLYVLRGASEALNNFYYGHMPADDPNDADGGDVDALEAVRAATIEYYS